MPTSKTPVQKPAPSRARAPGQSSARPAAGRAARQSAPRPAAQPASVDATKAVKPRKADEPVKSGKATKAPKLRGKPVRDSFTMPEADFSLIAELKTRMLSARRETKKSELLRAGLHALAALDTPALLAALGRLDPIKVGRPKKGH